MKHNRRRPPAGRGCRHPCSSASTRMPPASIAGRRSTSSPCLRTGTRRLSSRSRHSPAVEIATLRAYVRHRETLLENAATHIQRMRKALVQMNLHPHLVISDITGVRGLRILRGIVVGRRDPQALVEHRDYRATAILRLAYRVGKPKAITATARKLAILVYRALQHVLVYGDPGAAAYDSHHRAWVLRRLRERAANLGFALVNLETGEAAEGAVPSPTSV